MAKVHFFYEAIDYRSKQEKTLKKWIRDIIKKEEYQFKELNYIFCKDNYLHQINLEYLNHDTLTDIITFDNSEVENTLEGDIFISIERVAENAEKYQVSFEEELHRVMIHGVLHLVGYKDKSPEEQRKMSEKENECLKLLSF